ncbi:OmpP1/FadL family transporter [Chitinimonas sp.]|uniref:OmpP1/FadL family transporter n=1 Tax=Chitinimonas sp. TaxID=1934313 RepID=UPI0035B050D9
MKKQAIRVSALLVSMALAQQALASGYHFGTQSASAQGTANASGAAADDASTIFYNPAGLTHLKGTNVSGVLDLVLPSGDYTDQGSYTAAGPANLTSAYTGKTDGGKFVKATAVPHTYFSRQINDRATFGIGVFVPFGSKTKYDENWAGRYNVIETELKTIAINPSFAFKVNDQLSIGAGVTAQFIEGKLVKGADMGTGVVALVAPGIVANAQKAAAGAQQAAAAAQQAAAAGNAALAAQYAATAQQLGATAKSLAATASGLATRLGGNPAYSGKVDVDGDDWGYGWNLGLMYDIDADTRIGLAYRSAIKHKLSGTGDWTVPQTFATDPALVALGLGSGVQASLNARYADGPAALDVDTPDSVSLSVFKQINPKVALMADFTHTGHSKFQELRIKFGNGTLKDSVTPENWGDTNKISVGGTYQYSDAVKLRAGLAYDKSPVKDSNRTPSIPDKDRKWVSLGANIALTKESSVDLAWSFVQVGEPVVNITDNGGFANCTLATANSTTSCATMIGKYKVSSHVLGLQYNRGF